MGPLATPFRAVKGAEVPSLGHFVAVEGQIIATHNSRRRIYGRYTTLNREFLPHRSIYFQTRNKRYSARIRRTKRVCQFSARPLLRTAHGNATVARQDLARTHGYQTSMKRRPERCPGPSTGQAFMPLTNQFRVSNGSITASISRTSATDMADPC